MRYPVLFARHDGWEGRYQVTVVDLPGCVAYGDSLDDALLRAEKALQDWVTVIEGLGQQIPDPTPIEEVAVPEGSALASILKVQARLDRPNARVSLTIDEGILESIDDEARRRGLNRKTFIEYMVRFLASHGG